MISASSLAPQLRFLPAGVYSALFLAAFALSVIHIKTSDMVGMPYFLPILLALPAFIPTIAAISFVAPDVIDNNISYIVLACGIVTASMVHALTMLIASCWRRSPSGRVFWAIAGAIVVTSTVVMGMYTVAIVRT